MSNLDYFRRPVLAGNTLTRTQVATIRGSVRRNDADGVSTVPYFPGLTGKTLQIKIEGTTYLVTFTSDVFLTALSEINAVIDGHAIGVANGFASDSDGTVTLQSTSTDGLGAQLRAQGSIEIVGGTATSILGLDIALHPLKAYGGELLGTAEGRVRNPFRTAFLNRDEGLSVNSVNRNLAALSANSDVLFSHHNREDAVLQKVNTFTNNGSYITVGAGVSVPIGLGLLTASATKEDLAPFFQIIDTATGQPHASRVVGVVKGTPGGVYPSGWPYTNQTVWADNLGRNLLGQQLDKNPGGTAITGITEGRYVSCAGAPFIQAVAGDFVAISGATNTDSLDNNGFKWVVESVISNSIVALRPMSKSELDLVGYVSTSVQPSVDLADTKQSAQSYGSITVRTGAFATVPATQPASLNLVVFPEIPAGSTVELWMAQPRNLMDVGPYDIQKAAGQVLKQNVSDLDVAPNGLLSSPTLSVAGPNLNIGVFYVRWHGKVVRVPASTLTAPANPFGYSILYWDEDTNSVKSFLSSTSPGVYNPTSIFSGAAEPSAVTSGTGFQIASASSSSSNWSQVFAASKVENGKKSVVTVGHGGDFSSLTEAARFLLDLKNSTSETVSSNGTFPHFEIVLLSDQTITSMVIFSVPSLTIRGVNSSIRLISNQALGNAVFYTDSGSLTVENLTVKMLTGQQLFVWSGATTASNVILRNVRQDLTGALPMQKVVRVTANTTDVLIEDCSFTTVLYIVDSPTAGGNINISRSTIGYQFLAPYTTPQFFPCDLLTLRISESSFPNWKGSFGWTVFSDLVSPSLVDVSISNSRFDFGLQTDVTACFMRSGSVRCLLSNCYINMTGNTGINQASGDNTTIRDCTITTNAFGIGGSINASRFLSNKVVLAADSVSNTNGYLLDQVREVSGNSFSGTQAAYYVRVNDGGVASNNYFNIEASSWLAQTTSVIEAIGDGVVSGNYIEGAGVCAQAITISSRCSVTENWVLSSGGCGIYIGSGESIVNGNVVNGPAEAINGTANDGNIVSNNRFTSATLPGALPFGGEFSGNVYNIGAMSFTRNSVNRELLIRDCTFVGNFEFTGSNMSISGCDFTGTTIIQSRLDSLPLQMSGVRFHGPTTLVACYADGCVVERDGSTAAFVGNTFLTGCTMTNCAFTPFSYSSDWIRVRNCTLVGCRSFCAIADNASINSDYNYIFDTFCYALTTVANTYVGLFFSERTYKLVVEGCDVAWIGGDFGTNNGPRDVSISSTRTEKIDFLAAAQVSVTDCKIGLRNTKGNILSAGLEITFNPWSNLRAVLTGAVTFTNGSTSVTGASTKFVTEVQVGDLIRLSAHADSVLGKVASISSDTSLTLAAGYAGISGSGAAVSGAARGTFTGNDIDDPTGSNVFFDAGVCPDVCLIVSGNRITGKLEAAMPYANGGTYTSSLVAQGNHVSLSLDVDAYSSVMLNITGNYLAQGASVTYNPSGGGLPAWGTTFFSGVFSNNTFHGAVDLRFVRGLAITGNTIVCTPTNTLLSFFRCLDVVIDGNYIYKTASNGANKLLSFDDVRRIRLTNNILGSAWVTPDSSELITFLGNSAGTIGYDMIIMGNHMYLVGAAAPAPTQASLIASATVYFLLDTATSMTSPSRLGGTISNPTAP